MAQRMARLRSNGQPKAEPQTAPAPAVDRAERRGFAPGGEIEDWLEAEAQVRERVRVLEARL
jgi:hypothetical protein